MRVARLFAFFVAFVAGSFVAPSANADEPPSPVDVPSPPIETPSDELNEPRPPAPPPSEPPALENAPEKPPPPPRDYTLAYGTGAAALAAAAGGAVLGIFAIVDASDYKQHPTLSAANGGKNVAFAADVCFGVAATLAVTTLVLLFKKERPRPALSPAAASIVRF